MRRKGSRRRRHDATQRAESLLLSTEKQNGQAKMLVRFVGGNKVSDIELYGYKKEAKYIVKIAL